MGIKGLSGGSLGDVLVKYVLCFEVEKMVVKIVGDGGRNEMKKCLFVVVNLVLDFGLMFVKYVFCFEWEKKVVIEVVVK